MAAAAARGVQLNGPNRGGRLQPDGQRIECRIAIPLAARGLRVDGIDFSADMVARMRTKAGGADLRTTIGDFAGVPVSAGEHVRMNAELAQPALGIEMAQHLHDIRRNVNARAEPFEGPR